MQKRLRQCPVPGVGVLLRRLGRIAGGAMLMAATAAPTHAQPIDYDSLDEATRAAIKTACYGWVYEDAANWIAGWLGGVSPLCDAEEQARLRALHQAPASTSQPRPYLGPDYVPTDFGSRTDPLASLRNECNNDYMCTRMRQRAGEAGRSVSMAEYERIADHCEGEYGCIERVFEPLPNIEIPPEREEISSSAAPVDGTPARPDPASPAVQDDLTAASSTGAVAEAAVTVPVAARMPPGADRPAAGKLLDASIRLEGQDPATLKMEARYRNLAPVHLRIGPVELEMTCRDGSSGCAFSGGALWLAPGETDSLSMSGERTVHGQSCPAGIERYEPTGLVRHLQAGIGGYAEQVAVCPDGRNVAIVLVMADALGQRYAFHTGDGRAIEVDVADYDARRILGRICGTETVDEARREFVASGIAYLSRDYFNFMNAWSRACANTPATCAQDYAAWTGTHPR